MKEGNENKKQIIFLTMYSTSNIYYLMNIIKEIEYDFIRSEG